MLSVEATEGTFWTLKGPTAAAGASHRHICWASCISTGEAEEPCCEPDDLTFSNEEKQKSHKTYSEGFFRLYYNKQQHKSSPKKNLNTP